MQRHSFQALNSTFVVDSEYQFVKELGQGAYGCVVAAKHRRSGEGCAIKKITAINTKVCPICFGFAYEIVFKYYHLQRILTKRCLREIKYVSSNLHYIPSLMLSQIASPLPWSQKC